MVFITLLCGFGLYQTVYFGKASYAQYAVTNALKHWQTFPSDHSNIEYSRIKTKAQEIVIHQPDYAEYWELLAQVSEWGTIFGYEKTEQSLFEAKKHYLRATELRPLWPDTWAALVKLKWRLQEFDEEMLFYLERATTLGPQKPDIHFLVIELGLALYINNHSMLLTIRPEFHRRLALGLKHSDTRQQVRKLITDYDLQLLACRWLKNEDLKTRKLIPKCK
jgi:hypothetical protein